MCQYISIYRSKSYARRNELNLEVNNADYAYFVNNKEILLVFSYL